jgi:sec-independent protein translocase protein TatB
MFGIDFSEILVIFGIALVVLGPEKLPRLAATIGRWIGRARNMARQFRDQLEQEANALNRDLELREREAATRKAEASQPQPTPPVPASPPATAPAPESAPWMNGVDTAPAPPAPVEAAPDITPPEHSTAYAAPIPEQPAAATAQVHERGQ